MNFKIISGYTKNTPYETEVKHLISSLDRYNIINYRIISYDNLGSWSKNCQYKAIIIYEELKKTQTPIVWLDADAVLYEYPSLFDSIDKDIAFCDYYGGVNTASLYFKPTEDILRLCQQWINLNAANPKPILGDQGNLDLLIKQTNTPYYALPVSYCKIDFAKCNEKIIIGQNQASRRFKDTINNKNITIQYATHLQILTKYLMTLKENDTIVETGCGFFSSPVISAIAESKKLNYFIYYSDDSYKNQISQFVKNATYIKINNWNNWKPDIDASIYFHDSEELIVNRYKRIHKILPHTKYLILHDYDTYFARKCDMTQLNLIEEFKELKPTTGVIQGYL